MFAGLETAAAANPTVPEKITLGHSFEIKPSLSVFLPVRISTTDGQRDALPCPTQGSGDFTSLVGTDGFVELAPGPRVIPEGTPVPLYGW